MNLSSAGNGLPRLGWSSFLVTVLVMGVVILPAAEAPRKRTEHALRHGKAADVGIDRERLDHAVQLIEHAVSSDELRGAVLLVARHGQVVLHQAIGVRDLDGKIPMEKDSLFKMASNTKALTASGILLLMQNGKLELDDAVAKHLASFDNDKSREITIRQLLTHTSGWRIKPLFLSPLLKPDQIGSGASRLVREVDRFGEIGSEVKPGTSYSYSNAGYNTLAGIIESKTGSYENFLKTHIYDPLGMTDCCNHESKADRSRMSTVFKRNDEGQWQARWTPEQDADFPFPRGSGGMVSTAWDYAVFCQMLLNGGTWNGKRILDAEVVQMATNPQGKHIGAAKNYGLGWVVSESGGEFSHTGSEGTWVWVNPQLDLIGMLLTQTKALSPPRKKFRDLVNAACIDVKSQASHVVAINKVTRQAGFYKDVFMNGGVNLRSRKILPAAETLELALELYAGNDVHSQSRLLIGDPMDRNGVLLYPDGQPRFRLIYVNGGGATKHGLSLTKTGRQRMRQYFDNGGSYCGSCAGSFLSGRNVDKRTEPRLGYLNIFPYNTLNTGLKKAKLTHSIPEDSPLLKYRDFGSDYNVEDVYHNNGNWLSTKEGPHLKDTQILAHYNNPDHKTHGGAAIWAYQSKDSLGRVVNIGSHPEGIESGEQLALMEACLLYALDGNGTPKLKGELEPGQVRKMTSRTSDQRPESCRIGDRQLHHFRLEVPKGGKSAAFRLEWAADAKLNLYLSPDRFAFPANAVHRATAGVSRQALETRLASGTWYVSVECETTVDAVRDEASGFYRYFGKTHVLNGVPYELELTYKEPQDAKPSR